MADSDQRPAFGTLFSGGVSERPKEHASKACVGATPPWVQIPPPPLLTRHDARLPRSWESGIRRSRPGGPPGAGSPRAHGCRTAVTSVDQVSPAPEGRAALRADTRPGPQPVAQPASRRSRLRCAAPGCCRRVVALDFEPGGSRQLRCVLRWTGPPVISETAGRTDRSAPGQAAAVDKVAVDEAAVDNSALGVARSATLGL
jgi:hypothetical protein